MMGLTPKENRRRIALLQAGEGPLGKMPPVVSVAQLAELRARKTTAAVSGRKATPRRAFTGRVPPRPGVV